MNQYQKNRKSFQLARNQFGAGLIEVLIVILLLGVGLVSMSRIQVVVLQEGGTANNRAVAVQLAQAKLDEFKTFKCPRFVSGSNCVSVNASDKDFFGIVSGADAAVISTLGGTPLNTSFSRSWTVVDYYLCGAGTSATTSNCTAPNTPKSFPDIKVIDITVTWSDARPNQSVVLTSAIQSSDSFSMADAFGGTGTVFGKPQVKYNPLGVPDAVPVVINIGNLRETSKPVPTVSRQGDSTLVKFSSTVYTANGSQNIAVSNDEFVTVSCVCEFNGTGLGMTPTRMVWNSVAQKLEHELGVQVEKTIGRVPTTGTSSSQPAACQLCCRDHHDVSGSSYPKYSPAQSSSGVHQHFRPNASGDLIAVTSGQYLEACRLKRIDGFFYVMQDWLLRDVVVMPKDDYLSASDGVALAAYQNYLASKLGHVVVGDPALNPEKTSLSDRNFVGLVAGQQAQLLARGLYIDPIYQCRPGLLTLESRQPCAAGNDPTQIDAQYRNDLATIKVANNPNDNWLRHVSFSEVNVTLLAGWVSGADRRITVDNEPVTDIVDPVTGYYTSYYRGRVTGYTGTGVGYGGAAITAELRTGNTGVTSGVMSRPGDPQGYDRYPGESAAALSDSIVVTRLNDGTNFGISGNFVLRFTSQSFKPKPNTWGVTASPASGVICRSTGNANAPGYSCTVPSGWSGTLTPFALAGGPGNDPAGTLYYFSPGSRTYANGVTSALSNQNFDFCREKSQCP